MNCIDGSLQLEFANNLFKHGGVANNQRFTNRSHFLIKQGFDRNLGSYACRIAHRYSYNWFFHLPSLVTSFKISFNPLINLTCSSFDWENRGGITLVSHNPISFISTFNAQSDSPKVL